VKYINHETSHYGIFLQSPAATFILGPNIFLGTKLSKNPQLLFIL